MMGDDEKRVLRNIENISGDRDLVKTIQSCIEMYKKRNEYKRNYGRRVVAGPAQWFNPGIND